MSVSVTKRAIFSHPTRMADVVAKLRTHRTVWAEDQSSPGFEALYTIRNSVGDAVVQIFLRLCARETTETIFSLVLRGMCLVAVQQV